MQAMSEEKELKEEYKKVQYFLYALTLKMFYQFLIIV